MDHQSLGKSSYVFFLCACLYLCASSAEAMALHKTSLPLLLPVTSSTLLHHSLTSRRKRGGTLGYVILLSTGLLN